MKSYESLSKEELRELLISNWMTHDAMWLMNTAQQRGMEAANAINKNSVKMMSRIEAKRLKKLLGVENPKTFDELKEFIQTGFKIIRGNFMDFEFEFLPPATILWKVPQCFAYDGVKRIGLIEKYDCGIVDRLLGWFDELGVLYQMHPVFNGCLKHATGNCGMKFEVKFR